VQEGLATAVDPATAQGKDLGHKEAILHLEVIQIRTVPLPVETTQAAEPTRSQARARVQEGLATAVDPATAQGKDLDHKEAILHLAMIRIYKIRHLILILLQMQLLASLRTLHPIRVQCPSPLHLAPHRVLDPAQSQIST
jgi:hypothetical protein